MSRKFNPEFYKFTFPFPIHRVKQTNIENFYILPATHTPHVHEKVQKWQVKRLKESEEYKNLFMVIRDAEHTAESPPAIISYICTSRVRILACDARRILKTIIEID